jgi:hypothetical protein
MSDNSTIAAALQTITASVQALGEMQAEASAQMSLVRSELVARFDQLDKAQSEIVDQLDKTQSEVFDQLHQTRSEIMDRIDRLQGTVELVREDARVNWATADTAMNRVKNSRDDIDGLLKLIQTMERRYQTLASIVDELRHPDAKKPGALS